MSPFETCCAMYATTLGSAPNWLNTLTVIMTATSRATTAAPISPKSSTFEANASSATDSVAMRFVSSIPRSEMAADRFSNSFADASLCFAISCKSFQFSNSAAIALLYICKASLAFSINRRCSSVRLFSNSVCKRFSSTTKFSCACWMSSGFRNACDLNVAKRIS